MNCLLIGIPLGEQNALNIPNMNSLLIGFPLGEQNALNIPNMNSLNDMNPDLISMMQWSQQQVTVQTFKINVHHFRKIEGCLNGH